MINHPWATFLGAFIDAIGGELRSTPIHWATRQGHLSMVVLLIQHGGDPNIHDGEGWNLIPRADGLGKTKTPIINSHISLMAEKGSSICHCSNLG